MVANPYRGEAPLKIGDDTIKLRFTWWTMAGLVGRFGGEWDIELNRAFEQYDVEAIAEALAIVDGEHSAEWFMEASPSWIEVKDAWVVAYNLFMFGLPTLEEVQEQNKEDEPKRPLATGTFWSSVGPLLSRLVWRRASSGSRRSTNAPPTSGQEAKA